MPRAYVSKRGGIRGRVLGTRLCVRVVHLFRRFCDERTAWGLGKRNTARGRCAVPTFRCLREGNRGGSRVCVYTNPLTIFEGVSVTNERRGGLSKRNTARGRCPVPIF